MTFWEDLRNSSLIRRNMGKTYVGPEKRKYQRIESPLFIFYRLKDSNTYETSKDITQNIASGGLMFEIDRPILQERTLDVEIYLPSIKHNELIFTVFALAKAKWTTQIDIAGKYEGSNKYRIGVEFVEVDNRERKAIAAYVQDRLKTEKQ